MAAHAGRARQVVIVVDVAVATLARRHSVQAGQREVGHVVVERRVRPRNCAVALGASLREVCCRMVRIRRSLVVLQVATHARRACQVEIVVDVAIAALPRRNCMAAR